MSANFEDAFGRVKELAAEFKANANFYLSPQYQEAEVRRDFIDKFLVVLGWDVNHDSQKNPYEQEVKVERKEHGASQRRADYAFYLAPNFRDVKFYIEAKKPHGDIATADNYFQVIRYGWNSQTPIAALFDFEQFEIVDCRFKPEVETALQRNLKKFHYSQYGDKEAFAEIYWLFSHEAVAGGSLEIYAETLPKKRGAVQRGLLKGGYQSIDEAFLEELDAHRDALAHIFKNSNPKLDGETLTEITQRTLDRLVFIRFLEDKLIEPQYLVAGFGERGSAWGDFIDTSRRLNGIYNGIVFKENAVLDKTVKVDDDQFSGICEALCHLNSAYDFNAIPIHILGSIYERFLGKVIVATDKRARVEEKPEVRKAGGVYYTPEYIVRYIVENTVGKLIEGKTPAQIAEMRFADIACGSGSFLLGVYDLLIRYHTKYYNDNPRKAKKGETAERDDGLHLSLQKKREILLASIYGVDIDAQAVEVAQLSLYLKLLQDETPASARGYQMEFHETLLPPLSKNIVCGNSLISTDISSGELFAPLEERKSNPLDYEQRFPEIMSHGGFDAIIGNPPYGATLTKRETEYLRSKYETSNKDLDTFSLFIERAIKSIKPDGRLSMIVPTGWYSGVKFSKLRRFVAVTTDPECFINLPYDVFADAWVDTTVFVVAKRIKACSWPRKESCKILLRTFPKRYRIRSTAEFSEDVSEADFAKWFSESGDEYLTYADSRETSLLKKIQKCGKPFSDFADIQRGVTPFHLTDKPSHKNSIPAFDGTVRRYSFDAGVKKFLRYDESLAEFKPARYFKGDRLLLRELISRQFQLQAVKVSSAFVTNKSMQSILPVADGPHLNYLLGILNSKLMSWYFLRRSNIAQRDDFPKIVLKETRQLPISPSVAGVRHDKIVSLVEQMLDAKRQLAGAQSDQDKDFYENKCATLDRQINALVYELYGLTTDEIKIVEQTTV